jgi:hypothetical protein
MAAQDRAEKKNKKITPVVMTPINIELLIA